VTDGRRHPVGGGGGLGGEPVVQNSVSLTSRPLRDAPGLPIRHRRASPLGCGAFRLQILWKYIPAESVDVVYLDPPFNSNRDYNVIFKDESGRKSRGRSLPNDLVHEPSRVKDRVEHNTSGAVQSSQAGLK
jgi:hypothetical protein